MPVAHVGDDAGWGRGGGAVRDLRGEAMNRAGLQALWLHDFERSISRVDKFMSLPARPFTPDVCRCTRLPATWAAVRRVAGEVIGFPVESVQVAWALLYFTSRLPDGETRLAAAVRAARDRWAGDVEAMR